VFVDHTPRSVFNSHLSVFIFVVATRFWWRPLWAELLLAGNRSIINHQASNCQWDLQHYTTSCFGIVFCFHSAPNFNTSNYIPTNVTLQLMFGPTYKGKSILFLMTICCCKERIVASSHVTGQSTSRLFIANIDSITSTHLLSLSNSMGSYQPSVLLNISADMFLS
jgi:hypothetical protein